MPDDERVPSYGQFDQKTYRSLDRRKKVPRERGPFGFSFVPVTSLYGMRFTCFWLASEATDTVRDGHRAAPQLTRRVAAHRSRSKCARDRPCSRCLPGSPRLPRSIAAPLVKSTFSRQVYTPHEFLGTFVITRFFSRPVPSRVPLASTTRLSHFSVLPTLSLAHDCNPFLHLSKALHFRPVIATRPCSSNHYWRLFH